MVAFRPHPLPRCSARVPICRCPPRVTPLMRFHDPLPTRAIPPPSEVMRETRPAPDAAHRKSLIRATGDTEAVAGRQIIVFAEGNGRADRDRAGRQRAAAALGTDDYRSSAAERRRRGEGDRAAGRGAQHRGRARERTAGGSSFPAGRGVPGCRALPAGCPGPGHTGDDRLPDPAGATEPVARGNQVATLLTMIVVDAGDPAFANPTKFVGPVYTKEAADKLAADKGRTFRQDGAAWRRVVPSPEPRKILEIEPITWLRDRGAVVVCAGGGGIPTMHPSSDTGELAGVEAVIDEDLAGELLAEDVAADLFLMATDVDGAYVDWGTPRQRRLGQVTPEELASYQFAAGSMGPKAEAAVRFAAKTGKRAAIGSLGDIAGIVAGDAGTNVVRGQLK